MVLRIIASLMVPFFQINDLFYAVRSSTEVLKFLWGPKIEVFNPLSFCGLKDAS